MNSGRIIVRRPDDWHLHLRDGAMLAAVLPHSARQFARAVVMPNLAPPVTDAAAAEAYRARILAVLPPGLDFTPLMTCYLTDHTTPAMIDEGVARGAFLAVKLYPAHATTNSAHGVTDLRARYPVLEAMARHRMPLLIHGEVTDPEVDVFDREAVFIERVLAPLRRDLPGLRIVFEHATTAEAVDYVREGGPDIAATLTAHHLMINRNALFQGGLRPHHYCLPVAKRERHRLALRAAAVSGDAHFFLGTDSAPHARRLKEADCGCAGLFTAGHALECYVQVFAEEGALDRFEGFASLNGPAFYGLPPNEARIALEPGAVPVPAALAAGDESLVPFRAGEVLGWTVSAA